MATRRSQPYRRGVARPQTFARQAMQKGRTAYGHNPADVKRAAQKKARLRRRIR